MPIYQRGDVVLINYPFLTDVGMQQKLRDLGFLHRKEDK